MDHTEFLAHALVSDGAQREVLWRAWRTGERDADARLRAALLQSVPEHSGYDPAAAERSLSSLLAESPPPDIAAIARVRLSELQARHECRDNIADLKARLAKIADIERQLDHNGKSKGK